jgi:hypothetical protein
MAIIDERNPVLFRARRAVTNGPVGINYGVRPACVAAKALMAAGEWYQPYIGQSESLAERDSH